MATMNYKCPACGAPLTFNPDTQRFDCEYCLSQFSPEKIQQMNAEGEGKEDSAQRAQQRANQSNTYDDDAVLYTCPSCGAEVVTTASTAATFCYYCHNPVVLGGRLSGQLKPEKVVPFALSREKAVETFMGFIKKKKFLPNDFASQKQIEKMTGIYFPYWYVDSQQDSFMTAIGTKVRSWRVGNKRYTETSKYRIVRGGDVIVNNVFERALKTTDRDMLQCVHPYDLRQAKDFSMSYLSGFFAEKRDLERHQLQQGVDARIDEYCKEVLKSTAPGYSSIMIESYRDRTDIEKWTYALLPVWVLTYKYKGKIYPYAINGQTGKTYGSLPASTGKLFALAGIITAGITLLGLLGGLLLL